MTTALDAGRDRPPRSCWGPLAAVGLVVTGAAWGSLATLLLPAALLLLAGRWSWSPRSLRLLALGALLLDAAQHLHVALERRSWAARAADRIAETLAAVERRTSHLVSSLQSAAERAAALPEAQAAIAGERRALAGLLASLRSLREASAERPALGIHPGAVSVLAWSGHIVDLSALQGLVETKKAVFVLEGSVSTTLIATAPIPRASGGPALGLATAQLAVATRRNIRNEFLSDFDRLQGHDPQVEIRYVDLRDAGEDAHPFPPLAPGLPARESVLRAPDGRVLAVARAAAPTVETTSAALRARYRRGVSALASAAWLVWLLSPSLRPRRRLALALGFTALRISLLVLGPPIPGPGSPLLSPDVYASVPFPGTGPTLLGAFLRSPLDLLWTTLLVSAFAALLLDKRLSRDPPRASTWGAMACGLLSLPVLAATFAWIGDTVANCSLDLEAISLIPRSPAHLVVQWSLLLVLASSAMLLAALFDRAGPWPAGRAQQALWLAGWAVLGTVSYRFWPRDVIGLPLLPALVLLLLGAATAATRARWLPQLRSAPVELKAGVLVAGVAALSILLYPSLVHFSEKNVRQQIERDHSPLVLRQPEWRAYVLAESRRKLDALDVLEDTDPGPHPPEIEELAFSVWSATDLAAFGFSSAVELQDPSGVLVSRFALNLPSLAGTVRPLPSSAEWQVSRERFTVASAERRVLHARRLLVYHGQVHGAVHLYVGDDFWNLPFLTSRDPYSVLFRTAPHAAAPKHPLGLLVYDGVGELVFSSAERPPALGPDLAGRVRRSPSGVWTTLPVDGRLRHVFLFSDGQAVFGIGYPRLAAGRYAADLVEAASGLTLSILTALLVLMLVRSLAGFPGLSLHTLVESVRRRFALRLFVAFIALAFVPVAVLQAVVGRFVADRLRAESENQALELAAVAKKAVEDFAFFQRGEAPGSRPVTDAALVWVASLIHNDLDVFAAGRLVASSKRELYASGLLSPRVPGSVQRALVLEGESSTLQTERIGSFSYLFVSVPIRLEATEPGILSIPLALRQREVAAVVEDLERTIRLSSVLFLAVAAALAHSMSRRISGPIRELTQATRRIAEGDLQARVAASSRDELLRLVESFNQMARDLDAQRRDLERSNRLAAWAEMARQVAHEVKNPLTPIQLSAEHLRRVYRDRSADFETTLETCTDTILRQVRILREIVTEFSAFARPPAPELETQDLRRLVAEVAKPYQAALPRGVSLTLEVNDGVPLVQADRRLLERAVLNLIENALQAVGDAGAVTLRLRSAAGGERAEMEVEDTGPGIQPEIKERVFEPFFSTKTSGSGLGLALVKKIAEDHGGGVALESEPGRPTRAILWLPAASPDPSA